MSWRKTFSAPIVINIDIILEITINLPQSSSDFHSDEMSSFLSSWEVEKRMQFATANSGNSWENVIFSDITLSGEICVYHSLNVSFVLFLPRDYPEKILFSFII